MRTHLPHSDSYGTIQCGPRIWGNQLVLSPRHASPQPRMLSRKDRVGSQLRHTKLPSDSSPKPGQGRWQSTPYACSLKAPFAQGWGCVFWYLRYLCDVSECSETGSPHLLLSFSPRIFHMNAALTALHVCSLVTAFVCLATPFHFLFSLLMLMCGGTWNLWMQRAARDYFKEVSL